MARPGGRRTLVPHNINEHFCGTPLKAVVRRVILFIIVTLRLGALAVK